MKKLLSIILICLELVVSLSAQNRGQNVRGIVIDAFTGSPLPGATVVIANSIPATGRTTDLNGEFTFNNIQPGRISCSASFIGYNTSTVTNVMVSSGKETVLTFKLEEKVTRLNDIVIKSTIDKQKSLNDLATVSARTFSVEETERFAGSLGDPSRMVANYAGVVAGNDSRNDIVIRGNSPMGLLWRIEGIEVPNPNHFGAQGTTGGPVSMLNSNLLTNSDFMTGAFPAEYGNALSGVFDINMRTGNKEKYEYTGQIGFNGFEAAIEGPISMGKDNPKGSFIADYRYSTLQLINQMGFDMGTGTAIPEYQDFTFSADLPTRKLGRFRVIGLWGKSYIQLGRSFDKNEAISHNQVGTGTDFGSGLGVIALTHTYMLSENTKLKSSFSYQNTTSNALVDTIDYDAKKYVMSYAGKLDENKLTASLQLKHRFNPQNNLTLGLSWNKYMTSYNDSAYSRKYKQILTVSQVNNEASVLLKGFANWQHKFTDLITLNTGLYFQHYNLNNENALEPRAGIKWQLHRRHTLSFGYGLHSQIQPRTTYFYKQYNDLIGTYKENNRNLKFTRSNHWVVGHDWMLSKQFRIKTELYYQQLYNAPVSEAEQQYSLLNAGSDYYVPTLDSMVNKGKGYNYGVELTIEKFMSQGYYALLTLSLFDSKYKGYDNIWRNTAFNTNYVANFLTGYEWKVGKRNYVTLDLRTVWSGGRRRTPIDLQASLKAGEEKRDWNKAYSEKYKDYFRTDLRIGFKQNLGRISQEWGLDLQNLTNHQNIFTEQYNNQTQDIALIYQQSFLPMFLYRINF